MRILADENLPRKLVGLLRERGHDVAWVKESSRGSPDDEILRRAQAEQRIVATFDKGFGELAFRWGLPATCGGILLRVRGAEPSAVARRAAEAIHGREDWAGHFAVVTDDRIRVRKLPEQARGGRKNP